MTLTPRDDIQMSVTLLALHAAAVERPNGRDNLLGFKDADATLGTPETQKSGSKQTFIFYTESYDVECLLMPNVIILYVILLW